MVINFYLEKVKKKKRYCELSHDISVFYFSHVNVIFGGVILIVMTVGNAKQTPFDVDSPVPNQDDVKTDVSAAKVSNKTAAPLKTILDKFKCEELLNEIKDIINAPGIQKNRKSVIIEILVKEILEDVSKTCIHMIFSPPIYNVRS